MKRVGFWLMVVMAAWLLAGCVTLFGGKDRAIAVIAPTQGYQVKGTVWLEQRGDRVMVIADLQGLPPDSEHGFHVHERGDCSAPDASSAGDHFKHGVQPHGHFKASSHHAGDLPNLKADSRGVAKVSFEVDGISVWPGPSSMVGRALVVTLDPDDYRTQPDGNSGARIGCGVIGLQ